MRALYVDLDGTFLGPGGSLFRDAGDAFTAAGTRTLEACHRAGIEVVIMSGRREAQVMEDARLFGQSAYIFEAGSGLVIDGEMEWLTGGLVPGARSISEQIEDAGAPDLLLSHFAGRLEYHEPWHLDREVSHLFRGLVDAFEADEVLHRNGHENLRVIDNGVVHRRSEALAALPQVRCYHLMPGQASKTRAVARHMQARGYEPVDCVGVGDSREDLGVASAVGAFWLVANAVAKDPTITQAAAEHDNVRVAEGSHGEGVYEAVVTTLAQRGG